MLEGLLQPGARRKLLEELGIDDAYGGRLGSEQARARAGAKRARFESCSCSAKARIIDLAAGPATPSC